MIDAVPSRLPAADCALEDGKKGKQQHRRHRDILMAQESLSLVFLETYRQRPVFQAAELELPNDENFEEMIPLRLVQLKALQ